MHSLGCLCPPFSTEAIQVGSHVAGYRLHAYKTPHGCLCSDHALLLERQVQETVCSLPMASHVDEVGGSLRVAVATHNVAFLCVHKRRSFSM